VPVISAFASRPSLTRRLPFSCFSESSTTDGTRTATGRLTAGQVTPVRFEARYTDGGKAKRTVIDFEGDRVADTVNDPVVRKTDDWIDMPAAQLVGAFDPAAAILVPARSMREVCRRTLRVYDGAMRADLKLGYLRTIPFSAKGYKGDAVTCRARLEPVAGYSPTKKDLIYIRDNGDIEISFAPVGRTGLFAPVRVKLRAQPATVLITATRFEQLAP